MISKTLNQISDKITQGFSTQESFTFEAALKPHKETLHSLHEDIPALMNLYQAISKAVLKEVKTMNTSLNKQQKSKKVKTTWVSPVKQATEELHIEIEKKEPHSGHVAPSDLDIVLPEAHRPRERAKSVYLGKRSIQELGNSDLNSEGEVSRMFMITRMLYNDKHEWFYQRSNEIEII